METRSVDFSSSSRLRGVAASILLIASSAAPVLFAASPAAALSEIQREEPAATPPADGDQSSPANEVPLPDPLSSAPPAADQPDTPEDQDEPQQVEPAKPGQDGGITNPRTDPDQPPPEVVYDLSKLPEPVRRMHDLIVEACKSGDIQKLRPLIGTGDSMTQLSLTEIDGDPIDFMKSLSGDSEGQEILAIMEEVLNAGYVHLDAGTPQELYVWPYFFALPLDKLDARQRVELFKLVTAGDYDDMKQFGAYIFYRLGIAPDGRWAFFVAGD
jgi:hypothetical protein